MFGYACDDTPELMPLPIFVAHRLAERLTQVRKSNELAYLRPDGKTQVTIAYEGDKAVRLDTLVLSTQHAPDVSLEGMLEPDIREHVITPVLEELRAGGSDLDVSAYRTLINPTGRFEIGGPMGDAGLTGRKIIVDTYGGMARHGGGAFSGKDPSKVDRSGAYAMRWVAKNVVAAGLARRCEVQVAYAIGKAAAGRALHRDVRHGDRAGRPDPGRDRHGVRPAPGGDRRRARPAPPDLRPHGGVRPLRPDQGGRGGATPSRGSTPTVSRHCGLLSPADTRFALVGDDTSAQRPAPRAGRCRCRRHAARPPGPGLRVRRPRGAGRRCRTGRQGAGALLRTGPRGVHRRAARRGRARGAADAAAQGRQPGARAHAADPCAVPGGGRSVRRHAERRRAPRRAQTPRHSGAQPPAPAADDEAVCR